MSDDGIRSFICKEGNNNCAECYSLDIKYISCKYGISLCEPCGEIHKNCLGDWVSIKSVTSTFTEEEIKTIHSQGNNAVRAEYEAILPEFYYRPHPHTEIECIREEFIRAKYERNEFQAGNEAKQIEYSGSSKKGKLMKRHRDENKFIERYFELTLANNCLKYFKPDGKEPRGILDLEKLNATFINHEVFRLPKNIMLINYVQDGATRNIFIYSNCSKEITDWFNAIRCCKMHRLCLSLSGMSNQVNTSTLADQLTFDYSMYGILEKTGPRPGDAWRKRWCMLGRRKLMYLDDSHAPVAKNEIFIGTRDEGYIAEAGAPENWRPHSGGYPFTLITPKRKYIFLAPERTQRDEWVMAINRAVDLPITLTDMKESAAVTARKS